MRSQLEALNRWIDEVAALTRPDRVQWCDGSDAEHRALVALLPADLGDHARVALAPLDPVA